MHYVAYFSKKRLSWLAAAALSSCITQSALACAPSDSVYLGAVCMTANLYCPDGYAEAQGQLMTINGNEALYSLFGITYGGDGQTTFGVPDLRGRSMIGYGQGPGLTYVPQGLERGQEDILQTISQMPSHTHSATTEGGGGPVSVTLTAKQVSGQNQPEEGFMLAAGGSGQAQAPIYIDPDTAGNTVELGGIEASGGGGGQVTIGYTGGTPAGSTAPIPTIPPQTALRGCIAIQGLYPPRPQN